ncbi:MAG: glycoside hydrolase family 97 N-terminal domain-containing protein, partial [Polyangiales bacterium]
MVGRLRTLSVGLVWLALFGCDSQREKQVREVVVASPSGDLQIAVTTDDEGRLTYSVTRGGEVIVETSPMGLSSTTHDLTGGVAMSESSV